MEPEQSPESSSDTPNLTETWGEQDSPALTVAQDPAEEAIPAEPVRSPALELPRPMARPTQLQEMVRKWIMLIPLTTAVVGSAAIQTLPTDQYADLLPPIFFVGALIVTAAMLHQRQLLTHNTALNDELQDAHERLDTLHHLALELNASLNVAQVAQAVLSHTLQLVEAESGALWLKTEMFPPQDLESLMALGTFETEDKNSGRALADTVELEKPWRLFAAHGLSGHRNEKHRATLRRWMGHLNDPVKLQNAGTGLLAEEGLVWIPISWKGETAGAIFVQTHKRSLSRESLVLLDDIALVAGPSLQNALLYQAAAERAEIDGLTRLLNHRSIQERLQQEVARVARSHKTNPQVHFAIAVMDIADFKLFNDTYGHAVGDQVLRSVSDCLKQTFRVSDIVGRFGGDEFLAILPDTPYHGSEVLCARAIAAIASQPFIAPDGSPITIRLTCGVASFPDNGTTPTEMLKAADERLYAAKRRGELLMDENGNRTSKEVFTLKPEWSSIGLLDTLISTIDGKDHYTRAQSERVWLYALMIAHQLGFTAEQMQAVHLAALVHDVGKIVVPDTILRKPGRLNSDEFRIMQQHTIFGAMIVRDLPQLDTILGAVRHHHEHWDGTGYPDKIVREQIPMLARILAVADSFAAMITPRPYRKALDEKRAVEEIERQRGVQYDPSVVDAFRTVLSSLAMDSEAFQKILLLNGLDYGCHLEVPEQEKNGASDASQEIPIALTGGTPNNN